MHKVFDCLCMEYSSEADTRLKSDNKGKESYDCQILVLATMRVLAWDAPFDSFDELTGISREKPGFVLMYLLSG